MPSVGSVEAFDLVQRAVKSCPPCAHCEMIVRDLIREEGVKVRRANGKMQEVRARIKHILLPRVSADKKGRLKLNDSHYSCNYCIENAGGEIKFLNKIEKDGFYRVDVDAFGRKDTFVKTFFPVCWCPRKVIYKVFEALEDAVAECGYGRKMAIGYTKEGFRIRFFLDIQPEYIEVVSACPCEKWILGE